jgi:hypothetical protein
MTTGFSSAKLGKVAKETSSLSSTSVLRKFSFCKCDS